MYADIFGTLPIAEALVWKRSRNWNSIILYDGGNGSFTSIYHFVKKVVKPKLLAIFVAVVTVGILIIGYTFNILGYLLM